jgi:hypothetical protein
MYLFNMLVFLHPSVFNRVHRIHFCSVLVSREPSREQEPTPSHASLEYEDTPKPTGQGGPGSPDPSNNGNDSNGGNGGNGGGGGGGGRGGPGGPGGNGPGGPGGPGGGPGPVGGVKDRPLLTLGLMPLCNL